MPAESNPKPADKPKPVVLVIEDDRALQSLISDQLDSADLEAVVQPNGPAALEWLQANQAQMVVLDLMLPGMDGYEIARRIRAEHSPTALPILMLSALGEEVGTRVKGIQAGANDFLAKPYNLGEFLARVSMLLQVRSETEQAEAMLNRYTTRLTRHQNRVDPKSLTMRQRHLAVVMFADLRGFTHMTTKTGAESALDVLDTFFTSMLQIVEHHNGIVFDLIGDEFLAAFNIPYDAPDSASLGLEAALHMGEKFQALRDGWTADGHHLGLGIGMHRGDVVLGDVGGSSLMRHTIVGSVVNVAHRLVDLAGDGELIMSDKVHEALAYIPQGTVIEAKGNATLKGVDEPQPIFRVSLYT